MYEHMYVHQFTIIVRSTDAALTAVCMTAVCIFTYVHQITISVRSTDSGLLLLLLYPTGLLLQRAV